MAKQDAGFDNPHNFSVRQSVNGSDFVIVNKRGDVLEHLHCHLTRDAAEDVIGELIADDDENKRLHRNRHEQQPDEPPQPLQCGARLWP